MASGLIGNEVPLSWGCEFESRVLRFNKVLYLYRAFFCLVVLFVGLPAS